jgi:hypothetical protein
MSAHKHPDVVSAALADKRRGLSPVLHLGRILPIQLQNVAVVVSVLESCGIDRLHLIMDNIIDSQNMTTS